MTYQDRVVDRELASRLEATGAVVLEGPKACGKTETARRAAASEVLLDVDIAARRAIAVDPALVLEGATPRLIDEWQLEPTIWNHVRRAVDDRGKPGQFILTGSAVPADDATQHTGAGRITRLRMRPMTLFETGHSNGAMLAWRLACERPDLVAAIAPNSGEARLDQLHCIKGPPVPVLAFHGTADPCATYKSGPCGDCSTCPMSPL